MRVFSDRDRRWAAPLPRALFGYLVDDETAVVGAARSNAGGAVAWTVDLLRVGGDDPVAAATAGRAPGGHRLVADPSLIAERSPAWPLSPSAGVERLRRTTTPLDVVQAFVEAVAVGLADAVDALEQWAGRQTLVLGGGASESAGWCHLLADSAVADESARGAAVAAFERMGVTPPLIPTGEAIVEPDPARAQAFARLRAAQPGRSFAASLGS